MGALILLVQIVVSLLVTALTLPALLATVPALREPGAGLAVAAGTIAITLISMRLVWPRRRA